jgi:carbon monoxide dehydrogenase subunit G
MKLSNEFTVAVPLERAWETLLDIERVASFLPGARIEPGGDDGVYHGTMRVKVGPIVTNYRGTARLVLADEHERVADIAVEAREAKGQGTAAAVIHNRLVEEAGGTRVIAETDVQITGRQAQFGRGIMQDVAGRMLDDFAGRFESYLLAQEPTPGEADAGAPPPPAETPAELDLGSVLYRTPAVRYGAGALMVFLILIALRLRGRGASA